MRSTLIVPSESFKIISPDVGFGFLNNTPENWQAITKYPLLILVGLTGVGKTTITKNLLNSEFNFTLLPNRRTLADKVIFPTFTQSEESIYCRIKRLEYTRKYQQIYSGGMAYILSQLKIPIKSEKSLLIFDGLRGKNEVIYAAQMLPNARFIVLEASDNTRLQRLINRQDVFDYIHPSSTESLSNPRNKQELKSFADLNMSEVSKFLTPTEQEEWLKIVNQGKIKVSVLKDKLKIIFKERQNYDIIETREAILKIAPERTLTLNTACYSCKHISQMILKNTNINQWLNKKSYNCS